MVSTWRDSNTMNANLPRVAFWLVPEARTRRLLEHTIRRMARRFAAPVFIPHLTVYSCERTNGQAELAVMARLARQSKAITLSVGQAETGDRLAQTLFYRIGTCRALQSLHQALQGEVPIPSGYCLQPHLSLLYHHLDPLQKNALAEDARSDLAEIRFDELRAVAIPARLSCVDDFREWQTLLVARLS